MDLMEIFHSEIPFIVKVLSVSGLWCRMCTVLCTMCWSYSTHTFRISTIHLNITRSCICCFMVGCHHLHVALLSNHCFGLKNALLCVSLSTKFITLS